MATAVATAPLDHRNYYRMPWTVTDNAMSWLEITTKCNISCKGCYRDARKEGHKTLRQIEQELEVFKKLRKSDGMSIAGGDPLVHPEIVEIVRQVREAGYKPLVNTNGQALTPELLHRLRKAGAASLTFHIDSTQKRKDFTARTEEEYNPLRKKFADMVAAEGGVTCGFNTTITRTNLHEVPALARWALANADRVHSFHFIPYRDFGVAPNLDMFVHGRRVAMNPQCTNPEYTRPTPVTTQEVVDHIRLADPLYEPAAYLGGTSNPKSFKWTFATRLVLNGKTLGYCGPRFMEWTQMGNHLLKGKWLGLSHPRLHSTAKTLLPVFFLFDKGVRASAFQYAKAVLRNPANLFRKVRLQMLLVLQPIDFLDDGALNMCDGCPDMTVHDGKLYWSCRLEEIKEYGAFLTASPKERTLPLAAKRYFQPVGAETAEVEAD